MSAADDPNGPTVILSEAYNPDSPESLSARIVRLVAVAADQRTTDLKPLGRVIDTEALDRLLDSRSVEHPESAIHLSLHYEGYRIDIDADGTVSVLVEDE